MFTIKHVTTFGNEELYLASRVDYSPYAVTRQMPSPPIEAGGPPQVRYGDLTGSVWYDDPKGGHFEIMGGSVYVMNESGATVSKWDLGGWAEPA